MLINLCCIDHGSILHHVLLCLYVVTSLINKVRKGLIFSTSIYTPIIGLDKPAIGLALYSIKPVCQEIQSLSFT